MGLVLDDLEGDLCPGCGAWLSDDRHGNQRWCSTACRKIYAGRRDRDRRAAEKGQRLCVECGDAISPVARADAKVCSEDCARALTRRQHKMKLRAGNAAGAVRICPVCLVTIEPLQHLLKRYCTVNCRNVAAVKRQGNQSTAEKVHLRCDPVTT
jgi:predicted nucleic acid-binding Zn ribbon protein